MDVLSKTTTDTIQKLVGEKIFCIEHIESYPLDSWSDNSSFADLILIGLIDVNQRLVIRDTGRRCCERRYLVIDDDLKQFIGTKFIGLTLKNCVGKQEYGEEAHEIQFLDIETSKGPIQIASHNEHNGYYGGFDAEAYMVDYNACPICKSAVHGEVRNHSLMWHDGEVWCSICNIKIREYDAG